MLTSQENFCETEWNYKWCDFVSELFSEMVQAMVYLSQTRNDLSLTKHKQDL